MEKKDTMTKTKYKGVTSWRKSGKGRIYWWARIQIGGKRLHIGYFDTPRAAAEAYDVAYINLHGLANVNRLNFPNRPTRVKRNRVSKKILERIDWKTGR